jgi:hypothetical protein
MGKEIPKTKRSEIKRLLRIERSVRGERGV